MKFKIVALSIKKHWELQRFLWFGTFTKLEIIKKKKNENEHADCVCIKRISTPTPRQKLSFGAICMIWRD